MTDHDRFLLAVTGAALALLAGAATLVAVAYARVRR